MAFVIYKTSIEILKIKVQNEKLRKSSRQAAILRKEYQGPKFLFLIFSF